MCTFCSYQRAIGTMQTLLYFLYFLVIWFCSIRFHFLKIAINLCCFFREMANDPFRPNSLRRHGFSFFLEGALFLINHDSAGAEITCKAINFCRNKAWTYLSPPPWKYCKKNKKEDFRKKTCRHFLHHLWMEWKATQTDSADTWDDSTAPSTALWEEGGWSRIKAENFHWNASHVAYNWSCEYTEQEWNPARMTNLLIKMQPYGIHPHSMFTTINAASLWWRTDSES